MAPLNLSELKNYIDPSTHIFISSDLTSKTENHRQLIRNELSQKLEDLNFLTHQKLLDLSELPSTEQLNISISHCKTLSGFAITNKNYSIGFDAESKERVSDRLIKRIASTKEISQTPEPMGLLSAKEACWKAINSTLPVATISQIETLDWNPITSQWVSFKAQISDESLDGQGFIQEQSGTYVSFFLLPSTFV